MRAVLLVGLLYLLAVALPARATLTNKFCTGLANVPLEQTGDPLASFSLTNLCLDFVTGSSFALDLRGRVTYKGINYEAVPSTCSGTYLFAAPQTISFVYDLNTTFCTPGNAIFGYCNWGCANFANTYVPFFDNIDTPLVMSITPGPDTPSTTWGGLPYDLKLVCNTTSCGSASNLVPPAPLPANAAVTNFVTNTLTVTGDASADVLRANYIRLPASYDNPVTSRFGSISSQVYQVLSSATVAFNSLIRTFYEVVASGSTLNGITSQLYLLPSGASTILATAVNQMRTEVFFYGSATIYTFTGVLTNTLAFTNATSVVLTAHNGFRSTLTQQNSSNSFNVTTRTGHLYNPTRATGLNVNVARGHACEGTGDGISANVCYYSTERTGATNNAWGHMDCNTANDGCSLMAGTAFDTKWSRCRAGAWCPGTGQDVYTDAGFLCSGTGCSGLSSSAVGVYDAGVQVLSTVSCTGATCTKSGKNLDITVSGGGVTSLAGTAGQISASASTGAITLSLPNPLQPTQSAPKLASLGAAAGTGGGASISNLVGTNNAFFFDLTTGSAPISAGGVIATFDWSSSWNVALNANGPACTAHIVNAEGVADPAGYMTTYGPKLYAIPTSGSVATSLDFKLATGASAVALPVVTTVKMLIRCDMAR